MAKDNNLKSLSQIRKEADEKLEAFGRKKTARLGNIELSLRSGRMTKEAAERDKALLAKQEQELLDHRDSLYEGHMTQKFNEQSNPPRGVGAAVPSELEQSQSREELLRNLNQSAEKPQKSQDINEQDQSKDDPQNSKGKQDPEKGDDDNSK